MKLNFLLLTYLALSTSESIKGGGVADLQYLFNKLTFAYEQTPQGFPINYTASSEYAGILALQNGSSDFSIGLGQPIYRSLSNVTSFPMFAEPFGFCYNLPGLSTPVNFTTEVLVGIFLGHIRTWDHPSILNLNPQLTFQHGNMPIRLYMRSGISAVYYVFSDFLSSHSQEWQQKYGRSTLLSETLVADLGIIETPGDNFALLSPVYFTPYSMTFTSIPLYQSYDIPSHVSCANLIINEHVVSPHYKSANVYFDASTLHPNGSVTLERGYPDAWPITGIIYVYLMLNNTPARCLNQKQVLEFFLWCSQSDNAYRPLISDGYVTIHGDKWNQVFNQILAMQCNATNLIQKHFNTIPTELVISLTTISTAFLVSIYVVGILLTWNYEKKFVGKVYNISLMFAASITYAALILHVFLPTDQICLARVWLTFLAASTFLGTVFSRNLQLRSIKKRLGKMCPLLKSISVFVAGVFLVLLINVVYLLIWTINDTVKAVESPSSLLGLDYSVYCVSHHSSVWFTVQLALYIALLLGGIWIVYSIWNVKNKVDDARMIGMSVYVALLINIISIFVINQLDYVGLYYWAHIYLLGIEVSFSFSIFLPKLVRYYKQFPTSATVSENSVESEQSINEL